MMENRILDAVDWCVNRAQARGACLPALMEIAAWTVIATGAAHGFRLREEAPIAGAIFLGFMLLYAVVLCANIPSLRRDAALWDRVRTRDCYRRRGAERRLSSVHVVIRRIDFSFFLLFAVSFAIGHHPLDGSLACFALANLVDKYLTCAIPEEPKTEEDDIEDLAWNGA